jgi:arylsulfatase A-like enzyme
MRSYGCALLLGVAAPAFAAAPPNVVFIITDQQSADALSCRMGNRYLNTPAADRLAARGTFFTRAYAANPLCMPSRNAMFTGRYPHETGVTDNTPQQTGEKLDPAKFPTLGTYFTRAGYATAYFGKWHLCFDEAAPATHGFVTTDKQQMDSVTADHAVAYLRQKHDQPFLLVASFLNPHNVCELARGQPLSNGPIGDPPATPGALPPPPANAAPPRNEPDSMTRIRAGYHASPLFPVGNFSPEVWQALRWGYYRLIEKADAEIGRVLDALDAAGLADNTVVVFTSDHGECAGAHGFNQKTVLYEESARVPLIVCLPGGTARTADAFVNTGVDLLPTLLDVANIPRPATLPGASIRPFALGERVAGWPDQVVVENNLTQAGIVDGFVPMTAGRMVRTARYKYCVYQYGEQRESLVDLEKDPGEMTNLARDAAFHDVLLEHRERLRRFGTANADPLVAALLADDVKPRPFPQITEPKRNRAADKAARDRADEKAKR